MHPTLAVAEVLSDIFSHLDHGSLTQVARVCQTWNPNALDYLWADLPGLVHLVQTYNPIQSVWDIPEVTVSASIVLML